MAKLFNKSANYFRSIQWGGLSIFTVFAKQILLVPIFIMILGKEQYAFWLVITAIALMIRSLSLGQLNYTSNNINLYYHLKSKIDIIIADGQISSLFFVFVQILIGILISIPIVLSFVSNYDSNYISSINGSLCLALLVFARVIFQYCSLFLLRLFEPIEMIHKTIKWRVLGEVGDLILTVILILVTKDLFFTCIGIAFNSLVFLLIICRLINNNVPFDVFFVKNIKVQRIFFLFKNSFLLTVSFIIEKIYEIGLNLSIVRIYSALLLPLFSTTRVLSNASLSVSNVLAVPLMPGIQKQFATKEEWGVTQQMMKFWSATTILIILVITCIIPFLPFLYEVWTAGKIEFNLSLVCFLFMAISFQNYAIMFTEFFKKTNLAKEILTYNSIKVVVTLLLLCVFGYFDLVEGMGVSLLVGEVFGLTYFFRMVKINFFSNKSLKVFFLSVLPVIIFSISLFLYLMFKSYVLFSITNFAIIVLIGKLYLLNLDKEK